MNGYAWMTLSEIHRPFYYRGLAPVNAFGDAKDFDVGELLFCDDSQVGIFISADFYEVAPPRQFTAWSVVSYERLAPCTSLVNFLVHCHANAMGCPCRLAIERILFQRF